MSKKISETRCVEKNYFSSCKKSCFIFSLTLVIGMLYDMIKVKCTLMCQINKRHLVSQNFSSMPEFMLIFLKQKQATFHAYMT